ncbi:MAG: glycosyltransferase family 2 protein, partial [Anaerolineae bacterium]
GAGPLPIDFTYVQTSDVFPTNNTLLKKSSLAASGLFDLAYDTGERADGDLGMRLYLVGKDLVLNPVARVLHLHAPRGGLRQHRARVVTRAGSRSSLWQRHLLAATEGYLWCRYFTPRQVREAVLIRSFSTLQGRNGRFPRLIRFIVMLAALPLTYKQNMIRLQQGQKMLQTHPTIPDFQLSVLKLTEHR